MKVTITPEEFADFVAVFLFDQLRNKDEMIPTNEEWQELVDNMTKKGLLPVLVQYYTRLKGSNRLNYKRISPVFKTDTNKQYVINITGNPDLLHQIEPEKKSVIKDLVKKTMKLINQEKQRTGFLINEEKADKIVEYVIDNYYNVIEEEQCQGQLDQLHD